MRLVRSVQRSTSTESGSFECNPPFDEAIISKLAGHTERMLASRKDPLSFCVVVPKWTESQAWIVSPRACIARRM